MRKFLVISGFFGAGKSTVMRALADDMNRRGVKARVIVNDLGARNIVDAKFSNACGCGVTELPGQCICYQTENLVDKLRRLVDYEHADLVMSDMPGCGVGVLDHAYHRLNDRYAGEFDLAPSTVVADPETLRMLMPDTAHGGMPEEMAYLLGTQLAEADVVALNKIDCLDDAGIVSYLAFLKERCPDAAIFAVSARCGTRIGELADYLLTHGAGLRKVDTGYGGPAFVAAERKVSWYNGQCYVRSGGGFDGNAFAKDIVAAACAKLKAAGRDVPHLKLYAESAGGDCCKLSLLGVTRGILFDRSLEKPCRGLSVILNARAVCESETLAPIMDSSVLETAERYGLSCHVFFTECFGILDRGRFV